MKQLFSDAAYIGKLHWLEPGSTEVQALATSADEIVCSQHGRAEFCSIGFRKVREGLASQAAVRGVFAQFNADIAATIIVLLPLTDAILDRVETAFAAAPATTCLRAAVRPARGECDSVNTRPASACFRMNPKRYVARSALIMTAQDVSEFATVNVKDLEGQGFRKVWKPIAL